VTIFSGGAAGNRTRLCTRQFTFRAAVSFRVVPVQPGSLPATSFSRLDGVKSHHTFPIRSVQRG
jgi:hypothetical protein